MDKFDRTQEFNVDDMVKTIPVVCAWCNKIYHIKQWTVDIGQPTGVSHGMCPGCEKKQQDELEQLLAEKNRKNSGEEI